MQILSICLFIYLFYIFHFELHIFLFAICQILQFHKFNLGLTFSVTFFLSHFFCYTFSATLFLSLFFCQTFSVTLFLSCILCLSLCVYFSISPLFFCLCLSLSLSLCLCFSLFSPLSLLYISLCLKFPCYGKSMDVFFLVSFMGIRNLILMYSY